MAVHVLTELVNLRAHAAAGEFVMGPIKVQIPEITDYWGDEGKTAEPIAKEYGELTF